MKQLRLVSWFSQFALSVIVPLLLCILASVWIHNRYQTGGWVIILGILLGIGSAFGGLLDSMHSMDKLAEESDRKTPTSYNDHS